MDPPKEQANEHLASRRLPRSGRPYQPANHTGTSDRRIIGRDTVGARRLEVLIGTISKGHGAQRHAHPSLEQASYLLRGAGVSEVYGQERHISAGDWGFSPKGVFHSFTVTSEEPAQVLVVYAPPYQEESAGRRRAQPGASAAGASATGNDCCRAGTRLLGRHRGRAG